MSGDFRVYLGVFETRSSRGGGAEVRGGGCYTFAVFVVEFWFGKNCWVSQLVRMCDNSPIGPANRHSSNE